MTPEQAIQEAKRGELRPVYVVAGEERLLADQVLSVLRDATLQGGVAGFNEDKFTAGEATADAILAAAKMLPMMAKRRLVVVRGLERWDARASRAEDDEEGASPAEPTKGVKEAGPLDRLAEYAKNPADTTVLVLVASKLHGQRRIATAAKKGGFWVACEPVPRRELAGWIEGAAGARGHAIPVEVADFLAEISGPDLAAVDDAVERLSLYVGPGAPITEDAVAKIVTRVRTSTVWELIDALGRRRLDRALSALADAYDPKSGGLPQLGAIAWSVRQLLKFESGLRSGLSPGDAAARAGAPPFRGGELAQVVRTIGRANLERWVTLLAEADLVLKGSKRPAHAVLEAMLVEMCR